MLEEMFFMTYKRNAEKYVHEMYKNGGLSSRMYSGYLVLYIPICSTSHTH